MQTKESRFSYSSSNIDDEKKIELYEKALSELNSVLSEVQNKISIMATINCLLRESLPYYFWTGFYLVEKNKLVVGPYQGTLGCLNIDFNRGVCGAAARTKSTQIVPDVHKFPGHIACDSKSKSEIVVPVFDAQDNLIAVFDVDSTELDSFNEVDEKYIKEILELFRR